MPKHFDKEVPGVGISSRAHYVGQSAGGRARYPFKAMVKNDYFTVDNLEKAIQVRNALKSFRRRFPDRAYTVRPEVANRALWVVRRVL